jgi:hypothetical protein
MNFVKMVFIMAHNGGNMKSWLCSHFQIATNADSQFFILRVVVSVFIINLKINKL